MVSNRGEILLTNPAFENFLGYSSKELLTINFTNITYKDDIEKDIMEYYALCLNKKKFYSLEKRYIKKNKSIVWGFLTVSGIYDERGRFLFAVAMVEDITQRKIIENALKYLAHNLSKTTGEIFFKNLIAYLAKILEFEYVCIGKFNNNLLETISLYENGVFIENIETIPCALLINQKETIVYYKDMWKLFPNEFYIFNKKIESYLSIPLKDEKNTALGFLVMLSQKTIQKFDLTFSVIEVFATRAVSELLRLHTENALKESENSYRQIVETANEGIWLLDEQDKTVFVNPKMLEILKCSKETIYRKNLSDFIVSDTEAIQEQHNYQQQELYLQREDNSKIWVLLNASPIFKEKNYTGSLLMITDITERKTQQAQLIQAQKMETLGQLTGGIAHDFNNLLTIIMGNLDLLYDDIKNKNIERLLQSKNLFNDCLFAVREGAALIKRLLSFSSNKMQDIDLLKINQVVADFVYILKRSLYKNINLYIFLQKDLAFAYVDKTILQSVLLNLAINAQDAMPQGGKLTIRTYRKFIGISHSFRKYVPDIGFYIVIDVEDTGIGMDEKVLQQATEPFFTTKTKGSGLGLSMVYNFAKQANGGFCIESKLGVGTKVVLLLPELYHTSNKNILEESLDTLIFKDTKTILVVEDDSKVRNFAVNVLTMLKLKVLPAENAQKALEILANEKIDLLFSDIIMPDQNGYILAQQAIIKQPHIKILLTSGFHIPLEEKKFNIINKPYSKKQLIQAINKLFK